MSTRTLRSTRQSSSLQHESPEKENTTKQNGVKQEPKSRTKPASKARKLYCSCRQSDDGSPMILCSECKEWYHFKCLDLDEREAEDIQVFVCPSCHEKTDLRTVMDWEGPEALESRNATQATTPTPLQQNVSPEPIKQHPQTPETSDDGSTDEYMAENVNPKPKSRRGYPTRSDSGAVSDDDVKPKASTRPVRRPSAITVTTRTRTVSGSPGPTTPLKRRQSTASSQPQPKRKRSESAAAGAGPDAARKYCLTKLHELFRDIFFRYPVLGESPEDERTIVEKKPEELSAEEKEQLEMKANQFATELEECMFELYAEPDVKTGNDGVAAKYKERFRMITFNLSKPDRVILHKRIASSHISPRELSTMSSTDLADEETKQSIKQAEQEALEQTILKKTLMPTAKMTHKGFQDIEDVTGTALREREREREQEEEERIERERQERLKLQAQKAARGSAPPDSPVTPATPSWGAPPPVPAHALHSHESSASPTTGRPPVNPLFHQTSSEIVHTPVEHELNLADLINIDEDPGQEVSISFATPTVPPISGSASASTDTQGSPDLATPSTPGPLSISATGISPFASRSAHSDLAPQPSFDLNAIWSPQDGAASDAGAGDSEEHPVQERSRPETTTGSPMGVDIITDQAEDQDFDMFLNGGDDEREVSPPAEPVQESFDSQPSVWKGKISMPLDSTIPQEVDVKAQLVGGRKLEADSPLWKALFLVDHLRIDGRVPVDKSAQYLTQSRLNASRELIAVAFSPESEASARNFELLSKFLIDKGRHGLIFPWGHRPKEHHPGRELYIIPLVSSESLPDFIELLDDLQLPKVRTTNYLIGIWILTKGKLVPPPAAPTPPTPVLRTHTPALPGASVTPPLLTTPPQPSQIVSSVPLSIHSISPPTVPASTTTSSAALAAEVASLTPEQIQLMLRTLSANSAAALPSFTAQPLVQPPPPPPSISPAMPHIPPHTPQPWASMPPYPPTYPPAPMSTASHSQLPPPPQPPYIPPPFEQGHPPYGYAPSGPPPPHGGHQYDSYDRGHERGGHRGRGGRNRGRGGQQPQQHSERPRDSGWGGRGRGRGRGGHGGSSPDKGRWGGSPQRWN